MSYIQQISEETVKFEFHQKTISSTIRHAKRSEKLKF